jgi:hypothetical protein
LVCRSRRKILVSYIAEIEKGEGDCRLPLAASYCGRL